MREEYFQIVKLIYVSFIHLNNIVHGIKYI